MAKIKMDLIVEHLGVQLQGAMKDTIRDMKLVDVTERICCARSRRRLR